MPNHVTNVIAIHGVPNSRMAEIIKTVHMDDIKHRNSIDFDKITPMPPELNVESSSYSSKALEFYSLYVKHQGGEDAWFREKIMTEYNADQKLMDFGRQLYENKQKHGAADWYDWSCKNWGSKWNAYGYETPASHNADNEIEFQTAWSNAGPILERLSEMFPDAQFHYRWADEDIGANVGEQIWQNGEITEENIPEQKSAEAYEMAAAILSVDLGEHGYVYDEESHTYRCHEELDIENMADEDEELGGMNLQ